MLRNSVFVGQRFEKVYWPNHQGSDARMKTPWAKTPTDGTQYSSRKKCHNLTAPKACKFASWMYCEWSWNCNFLIL